MWGATWYESNGGVEPDVSIHAPVWGATVAGAAIFFKVKCFNPRPRVGGDDIISTTASSPTGFNPRPRVGGDYKLSTCKGAPKGFNPRPRVGGD